MYMMLENDIEVKGNPINKGTMLLLSEGNLLRFKDGHIPTDLQLSVADVEFIKGNSRLNP